MNVMNQKSEIRTMLIAGSVVGVVGALMVLFGNPANMGFCIACFLRDSAGALGMHGACAVQYMRPEIAGLVLGSLIMALCRREFSPRGGSSPATRFILGFFVMVGCLMFLGCPFRMALRFAGGDLNALMGLLGFVIGILAGVVFLKCGYSLGRAYRQPTLEGAAFPVLVLAALAILVVAPEILRFSETGPGAQHAAVIISLAAGLLVGALAQRTRLCMAGGVRDLALMRDGRLISAFAAIFVGALVCNLVLTLTGAGTFVKFSFESQPVAHTDGLWNALGMIVVGFGSALLGGCPLRQLVLAGEGNSDSAVTIIGMVAGAAACHNFGLASSAQGPTQAGKIAVVIAIVVMLTVACVNTFVKRRQDK